MSKTLVDSIFPYWLGTEWDFNGYTERPRKVVVCGYFFLHGKLSSHRELVKFKQLLKHHTITQNHANSPTYPPSSE